MALTMRSLALAVMVIHSYWGNVQAYWDDDFEDGMSSIQEMESARRQAEMRQGTLLQITKPTKGRAAPMKTTVFEEERPAPGLAAASPKRRGAKDARSAGGMSLLEVIAPITGRLAPEGQEV
mmetsp:Transcript_11005/g.25147  ORF Transcript_11005/g.25147 Transcript_11005/m.25147 type:complete len:122 (-) Transcript_11005:180-545(-)|eukprot:CAMPEP_0178401442 /NCGR_PEP_ID=MMETSP0689_2-20121128/16304_1 /TAXON_ID=160604 /ORGANISM="Amphidinium massartii, Strain CS-259" /LENGTH=121 /DNA_ID=CAMNT_0020022263 /DNA_START=114 /DNA_END=479 /DNA_ORIENTATION=-